MIIADTHTWIWWVGPVKALSARAYETLERADGIGVSAISCWEVAMLAHRNRITLGTDVRSWVSEATRVRNVRLMALTPGVGTRAGTLDDSWITDPADRIIVATAIEYGMPLVTKDGRIRRSGLVETIW